MSLFITIVLLCVTLIPQDTKAIEFNKSDEFNSDYVHDKLGNVKFYLHTRKNPHKPYILQFQNNDTLENSPFNTENDTVIIVHGFKESAFAGVSPIISDAYLARDDYNIIRVDWSSLVIIPSYIIASKNTRVVGTHVAQLIKWLESRNAIFLLRLHVIGVSLGAHIAGFMAKELSPEKVGRITGLDPASPLYESSSASDRLDQTDAIFVDVIHTSTGLWGIEQPIGHADFYPNGGTAQIGCNFPNIVCSHRRSWAYYAESVTNEFGFPALLCEKWKPSIENCNKDADTFMGFDSDPKIHGIFFLQTNYESPFAKNSTDYSHMNTIY